MADATTITQVHRSRNILLEILHEQGYDVSEYINCSISMISAMMETKRLDLKLSHRNTDKQLFVKYHLDSKLVIPNVTCTFFDEDEPILQKTDDLIIISKIDPNDTMMADMDKIWNDSGIFVSVINIKRLQFNILKHVQVPKHVVLTEEEKKEVFSQFHIRTGADLPVIRRYDPVATILCMRPGMVCKIYRKSKTAVLTEYYRCCV
jgi:DNA-directed RNA polymerase subunit H (RpoH/RPB5)